MPAKTVLSIVVPAYNEAERLRLSLPPLADLVSAIDSFELLVVDDGSTDETAPRASACLDGIPNARVVRLDRNRGKGAAVRRGVAEARGRSIVFMDADLATDLRDLPFLLANLQEAEVVIGSRAARGAIVAGSARRRRIMGRAFNAFVRAVTGIETRDTQCGFKGFRSSGGKLLFHLSTISGFAFDVEILAIAMRLGLSTAEIPVHWRAVAGSHVSELRDSVRMAADVIKAELRWRKPPGVPAVVLRPPKGDGVGGAETVSLLQRSLREHDTVSEVGGDAIALLPCSRPWVATRIARRIAKALPDFQVGPVVLPPADALRVARAAVGGPVAGSGPPGPRSEDPGSETAA